MIPIQTKNNALGVGGWHGGEEGRERGTLIIGSYSGINMSRYWLVGRLGIFSLYSIAHLMLAVDDIRKTN